MPKFITLPRSGDPGAANAAATLQAIIDDPLFIVMVILGEPDGIDEIIALAKERAELAPDQRAVVHAPDPDVLAVDQLSEMREGSPFAVMAFWSLLGKVEARLRSAEAKNPLDVAEALAVAEAGGND